jgi:hypothetical protein
VTAALPRRPGLGCGRGDRTSPPSSGADDALEIERTARAEADVLMQGDPLLKDADEPVRVESTRWRAS